MQDLPLVVDLDGTLLRSDLLYESATSCIAARPGRLLDLPRWLLRGRAYLKYRLAREARIDVTVLPYNSALLTWLKREKEQGRTLVLATASHRLLAQQVATHLGIFDEVMASDGARNLKGLAKRDALVARFGEGGFDYIGNEAADLPVWETARRAHLVNTSAAVEAQAKLRENVVSVSHSTRMPHAWARALRLHQWVKNLLLFVPLLAGHHWNPALLIHGAIAFLLFGCCASSVYLLNDLIDLSDDRHHPYKRRRPLAAGALPIPCAVAAMLGLLALAFGGAYLLHLPAFTCGLGAYYLLTLAYSLQLKRLMAGDVVVLTLLYTLRIIVGTFVFGTELTFWLLAFSLFIFLSLALVKRYTELHSARLLDKRTKTRGRAYYPDDLPMISALGAASGYIAVLVLALYIQDPATGTLYQYPKLIWLACPLLMFWISRIWLLAHRGRMHSDPILFAIRDRVSLFTGALFGFIFWLAA